MLQRLTCPQGHRWEVADPRSDPQGISPLRCPVCGSLADTFVEPGRSARTPRPPRYGEEIREPTRPAVEVPDYEILEELGRGGVGVVYKARQPVLGRLVAVKMLLGGGYAGPDDLARFHREAEAVARLRHPNIVTIHEVGETAGRPYFVLEYLPGGSLAIKLAGQPMLPRQAAEMVRTLARAVHFAHQNGILHRDLKPGNILLDADGTPKVADFGLARRLDLDTAALEARLTPSGAIMGTPSYMAPEQARGDTHPGPAVDVHALGAILYEMLTGRPPFVGETLSDTLQQVLDAEPVAPRRLNPRVPRDVQTICLRCLEKRPSGRYASAADLADDLERFLNGQLIRARPIGTLERAIKWTRRRPTQAALLAVSALALVLGGSGIVWHVIELADKNAALTHALSEEERQRKRNLQLLRIALEVQGDYGSYLDEQLKPLPHLTALRGQLLEKRLSFYQPILAQEPTDPEMRQTQAIAYLAVGILQQKLARFDEAEKAYQAALERLESADERTATAGRRFLAETYVQYGTLLTTLDRDDEAGRRLEEGEHLLERLVCEAPEESNQRALALAHHNRAVLLRKTGQVEAARRAYERAIDLRQHLIAEHPGEERYPRELAGSHINLAALLMHEQEAEQARRELRRAETILNRQPASVENRNLLAGIHRNLGILQQRQAPQESMREFEQALELGAGLLAQFPDVADYRRDAASCHFLLGLHHEAAGHLPQAIAALRASLSLSRELLRRAPATYSYQRDVCDALYHLGRLLHAGQQGAEAEALWRDQLAMLEKMVREHPEVPMPHQSLSLVLGQLGDLDCQHGLSPALLPCWPLSPAAPTTGAAVSTAALVSIGPAYLDRAAAAYRRGMQEERRLLRLGSPQPMRQYTGISRHALSLARVAGLRKNYADMADAAEGTAEAARGLAGQPESGRLYRLAAGCMMARAGLVSTTRELSPQEKNSQARRHTERAVELLRHAIAAGYRNASDLERDGTLAPLRTRPDFQHLLAELRRNNQ